MYNMDMQYLAAYCKTLQIVRWATIATLPVQPTGFLNNSEAYTTFFINKNQPFNRWSPRKDLPKEMKGPKSAAFLCFLRVSFAFFPSLSRPKFATHVPAILWQVACSKPVPELIRCCSEKGDAPWLFLGPFWVRMWWNCWVGWVEICQTFSVLHNTGVAVEIQIIKSWFFMMYPSKLSVFRFFKVQPPTFEPLTFTAQKPSDAGRQFLELNLLGAQHRSLPICRLGLGGKTFWKLLILGVNPPGNKSMSPTLAKCRSALGICYFPGMWYMLDMDMWDLYLFYGKIPLK